MRLKRGARRGCKKRGWMYYGRESRDCTVEGPVGQNGDPGHHCPGNWKRVTTGETAICMGAWGRTWEDQGKPVKKKKEVKSGS